MARLTNIRSVSVTGIGLLPLAEDPGTLTLSGEVRDQKNGRLPQHGGYLERWQGARLELNLNLVAGIDIAAINNIVDTDVTVRMSDGTVWMLAQASRESPIPIGNGEAAFVLFANEAERIT